MSSTLVYGRHHQYPSHQQYPSEPSRRIILNSREDLGRFKSQLRALRRLPPATIRLRTGVDLASDRAAVEDRLNLLYSDCGCAAGSMTAVTAALGSAVWIATRKRPVDVAVGLQSLEAVLAAALVGKLMGLTYSRFALIRLVGRTESGLTLEG